MSKKEADLALGNPGRLHRTAFYKKLRLRVSPRKPSQGENRTKKELEHGRVLPKITLVDGGERDFGVECSVVCPDASFQTLRIFWAPWPGSCSQL